MSAHIGQDWRNKTLKELTIQWQAVMLETWHHTAHIKGSLASKKISYHVLHPYVSEHLSKSNENKMVLKPKVLFLNLVDPDEEEDHASQYIHNIPQGT